MGTIAPILFVCPIAMNKTIRRASVFALLPVFSLLIRATKLAVAAAALEDGRRGR